MRFTIPFAALSIVLLLGACQTGGQKDPPATGGPRAGGPATSGPAAGGQTRRISPEGNAVALFQIVCNTLLSTRVPMVARTFGFVPARTDDMPAELRGALEKANGQMFVRAFGAPAVLVWSDPHICELWVGGVEIAGMEQEFDRFLGRMADAPNARSWVSRFSSETAARMRSPDGTRIRQGALILPHDFSATPPSIMVLLSREENDVFKAAMIHSVARPAQGAPGATTPRTGQPKDPAR